MIYNKKMLEIYTSAELNAFGKRYHGIMVKTGRGIITEDRTNGTITDDRTDEQINLVNKIVTSMLPVLERVAYSLTTVGSYRKYPFNLRSIDVKKVATPIADVVDEGTKCVIKRFHAYNPNRGNKKGSVYNFVIFQAGSGMAVHILKDIPNSAEVLTQIRKRTRNGLCKDEVFGNLPYIYHTSLTDILDGDGERMGKMELEGRYLTSNSNPEEEVIKEQRQELASKLLCTLNPREREILERRKGLNGYTEMTLERVGGIFGISNERVRQIEVSALKKLRKRAPKELVELVR